MVSKSSFFVLTMSFHLPHFDDFEIIQQLPDGMFGPTSLAKQISTSNLFVIKTFTKSLLGPNENVRKFITRNEEMKKLNFVFATTYRYIFQDEKAIYALRPYLCYQNLAEFLAENLFDYPKIIELWKAICHCFLLLHQNGIAPNAIKMSNIFVIDRRYVALTDLYEVFQGVSSTFKTTTAKQVQMLAPEYFENSHVDIGKPADVWALGCLLLLMGGFQLPWSSKNVFSMMRFLADDNNTEVQSENSIPPEIAAISKKALVKDPKSRPSIDELINNENQIAETKLLPTDGDNRKNKSFIKARSNKLGHTKSIIQSASTILSHQNLFNNCNFRHRDSPLSIGSYSNLNLICGVPSTGGASIQAAKSQPIKCASCKNLSIRTMLTQPV